MNSRKTFYQDFGIVLTVRFTRFTFSEDGLEIGDLGQDRSAVSFANVPGQGDGCADVIGEVEPVEVTEADLDSY